MCQGPILKADIDKGDPIPPPSLYPRALIKKKGTV